MTTERLLVLASSRKHGGRCIAGLSLDSNRLLRPVTGCGRGELSSYDTQLDPAPRELDVVSFGHHGFEGDPAQPENVILDESAWTNEGPMDAAEALRLIEPHLHTGDAILGNRGNAVPAHVAKNGMDESLCLIEPTGLQFVLTPEPKPRTRFTHGGKSWELPLTDFAVSGEMRRTGQPGAYSLAELGFGTSNRVILLLSLGTNNNNWHSKLVAGVLLFP
jgi:hypothetical protein